VLLIERAKERVKLSRPHQCRSIKEPDPGTGVTSDRRIAYFPYRFGKGCLYWVVLNIYIYGFPPPQAIYPFALLKFGYSHTLGAYQTLPTTLNTIKLIHASLRNSAKNNEINKIDTYNLTEHCQKQRNPRNCYLKDYPTLPGTTQSTKVVSQS